MSIKKMMNGLSEFCQALCLFFSFGFCAFVYAAPPVADDAEVTVTDPSGANIVLSATGSGTMNYIIETLPVHGWLFDSYDGLEIMTTPYPLQNDGNSLIYEPCPYYFNGADAFTFKANDGGNPPDGGDSNIATISLDMGMQWGTVYDADPNATHTNSLPFLTEAKKIRTQAIYHADELGGIAQTITNLALDIATPPAIAIQNWTIRMKHTTKTEYGWPEQFDNTDWTIVYSNVSESITETGWQHFAFQTGFAYDGVRNLMIDFSFNSEINTENSAFGYVYDSVTPEYRIIWQGSNTDDDDPLEFVDSQPTQLQSLPNLKLEGGQADTDILYADFDYNCSVDIEDLMTMIDTWLAHEGNEDYNDDCDISTLIDNKVDLADFAILALEWLEPKPLVPGDITGDGDVNLEDFSILSQQWQDFPGEPSADIALPLDNFVGIKDLLYLAENWLGGM
jgi:hypothetical protein